MGITFLAILADDKPIKLADRLQVETMQLVICEVFSLETTNTADHTIHD